MADKNENQGSIKKQLSGSGAPKGKKKLVIKKKVDQKNTRRKRRGIDNA